MYLANSPQDKLMGEVLGETEKFEQVLQEIDKSVQTYISDFKGKKDKQKNVYTERPKTPVTFFFDEIAKKRNQMFKKKKQKAGRLERPYYLCRKTEEMKPEKRMSVRSNSHPVKIEEEEVEEEEEEEKEQDYYYGLFKVGMSRSSEKYALSIHVPVPHPYIHPPVLPPPPPPPPDLLDDFNPDFQQPHVNFNPPDFENNVFHPIIINPLPPHHNNPAPPPPDYLE